MAQAAAKGCEIVLPLDVVLAKEFKDGADREVKAARAALESESRALADQVVAAVLGRKAS